MAHIAIIGGGITGVTSAYSLLQRGHRVTVLDRHRYASMETSFANGGQLSASNAEVWNSWATMLKGIRWMIRRDAPLLFNPTPSFHKYLWMAEFAGMMRGYRANTIETTRLAIAAREHLLAMAQAEGIEFDYQKRGLLHLYHDKRSFDVASKSNALLQEGGLERFAVTRQEIAQIEPAAQGDFYAGFYTPSDASGDIHLFTHGLATACVNKGAAFLYDSEVARIVPSGRGVDLSITVNGDALELAADAVVICAGVASRHLAASVGDRINIYPVKGYSITVRLDDEDSQLSAPQVALLDEAAKIVTSRLGPNRFRVAGTAEFNGYNRDIRADRVEPLIAWTRRHFPGVSTRAAIPWAGLRPMTPSMLPRVGRGRHPSVFYNTGHGHLGWTLSGATSEALSAVIEQSFPDSSISRTGRL